MHAARNYSWLDRLCLGLDQIIRTVTNTSHITGALYPGAALPLPELTAAEKQHAAGIMRVNHAGEICAQALYHGQALTTKTSLLKEHLRQAALEEGDHLAWCALRLSELGSHPSYLTVLWYLGSLAIGVAAGKIGDNFSLSFVAETEKQVVTHLEQQIASLPRTDERSQAILSQMLADEAKHREAALGAGGQALPKPVAIAMRFTAKIMVKTAYWV